MAVPKKNVRLILTLITAAAICMFLSSPYCEAADVPENEIDKLALLAFKSQIYDDPRGVFTSWNDSSDFCSWTGITCGSIIPRVTSLNLTQRGLAGSISPQLGNLSFISLLDLSGNFLNGEIPQELGNLGRLQNLNVSTNLLAGRIPNSLSNCSNLRNLSLDHNYLIGSVPPEIGLLSNLITLNLGSNNLTGTFPSSFGNLTVLQELDMSYNLLNGEVPSTVTQLRNLRFFRLSVNSLSGEFPPSLYNLTSLEFIALSFNNFTGNLRNDIGLVLPNLQRLWLPFNFFTGPIPNTFSNASNLQNIDLIRNNFTGKVPLNLGKLDLVQLNIGNNYLGTGEPDDLDFITALTNCSNLRALHLGQNQFGGQLPVSFVNLSTELTRLYINGNSIHGSIPRDIVNLQKLNILYMNSNNFSGTIPDSLGMLPNLGKLVLYSNRLTGQIPYSFGNMTSLLWLFLFDNRLEGGIPSSLAKLNQMVFFSVSQNNLTGIIPQEIISAQSLLSINMSFNSLTGPLPENIGNLTRLVEIDLSYNGFSGEIPNTLGDSLAMNIIFLQGNSFQGRFPNLAHLQNLQYLDLSKNNLSGNIPDYLTSLPSFLYLNLSFNNLEGLVPSTGVFSNVSALSIQNNPGLCGGAPELNLSSCPWREPPNVNRRRGVKHLKLIMVIVIPSFVSLSLLLLLIILLTRKKSKQAPDSISREPNFFPQLSYRELRKATNGFSPENLIGAGGFGSVYRGTLSSTEVAIKVLNLEQKGASKSFMTECLALKNIRHYNLVKVITACSSLDFSGNDFKALVYQLMPNGSLDKWLHPQEETPHRSLNILQRIDIVIDVASALHYLHHQCQTPIIHCDLKPQNVLLDNDLTARIGDFGLARLFPRFIMKENANQFSSLGIKGTIGYAPPEYGMGFKASLMGDVYSFGILLLEIFTGLRPTDDLFQKNMNLHQFVKVAIPDKVANVIDTSALCEEITGESETWEEGWSNLASEQRECLSRILQIGVECSVDSPRERMSMRQVCRELSLLSDIFTGTVFEEEKKHKRVTRLIDAV